MIIQLFIACQRGHYDIAKLLFENERIERNKPNDEGETPFFIACRNGHIKIVQYFLANERDVHLNTINFNGKTPIDTARENININFFFGLLVGLNYVYLLH